MPPKMNHPFFKATTFLILGGGIVCATTVLKLIAILTPCEYDDKIMDILSPIADFTHFCIIIWGSVVVFGKFCSFQLGTKIIPLGFNQTVLFCSVS